MRLKMLWIGLVIMTVLSSQAKAERGLFQRMSDKPVIPASGPGWRSWCTANAGIICDSTQVKLYLRGNDFFEGVEQSQIGLFLQPWKGFDPTKGWQEYAHNPVIPFGKTGEFDSRHALDTAPLLMPDGTVYLYYTACDEQWNYGIGVAVSRDGGYTFEKFATNPLKRHSGVCEVIYHDSRFYLFYPDALWDEEQRINHDLNRIYVVVSDRPDQFDFSQAQIALSPGVDSWDQLVVSGARIFHLANRWWMVYQGSNVHVDYPEYFHCAWSTNLIHWQKVRNSQRLFSRGPSGAWDQGAIWQGEVLEWQDNLYLFYEGWGSQGYTPLRNRAYYPGGQSQLGLASCSVKEFLEWAGIEDPKAPVAPAVPDQTYFFPKSEQH